MKKQPLIFLYPFALTVALTGFVASYAIHADTGAALNRETTEISSISKSLPELWFFFEKLRADVVALLTHSLAKSQSGYDVDATGRRPGSGHNLFLRSGERYYGNNAGGCVGSQRV